MANLYETNECGTALPACGCTAPAENCPLPDESCPSTLVELELDGCSGVVTVEAAGLEVASSGQILQLTVTLRSVCPGRQVALAVWLTGQGGCGQETLCGMRCVTVPAHYAQSCRDVAVRCLQFVLPGDAGCAARRVYVHMLANYLDAGGCGSCTALPACGCCDG